MDRNLFVQSDCHTFYLEDRLGLSLQLLHIVHIYVVNEMMSTLLLSEEITKGK